MMTRSKTVDLDPKRCIQEGCDFYQVSRAHKLCSGCAGLLKPHNYFNELVRDRRAHLITDAQYKIMYTCARMGGTSDVVIMRWAETTIHHITLSECMSAAQAIACHTTLVNNTRWVHDSHPNTLATLVMLLCYEPWKFRGHVSDVVMCHAGNAGQPFESEVKTEYHLKKRYIEFNTVLEYTLDLDTANAWVR